MVMDDPDIYELDEYDGIDLFIPGDDIEREIDGAGMFRALLLTLGSFGLTIGITILLMLPLLLLGFIYMDFYGNIYYDPWVFIFLTIAEIGFIIPPIWYVKNKGFSLRSIGIKKYEPVKEIVLGLIFGAIMLAANIAITWIIAEAANITYDESDSLLIAENWGEVIAWVLVMFVIVGFSEELIFRGYLQRRMEIYLRPKTTGYKLLALIITSALFSAFHLDLIGLPTRFVLGLFLGYLCQRRKNSILGPTIAHGFNNSAVVVFAFLGF